MYKTIAEEIQILKELARNTKTLDKKVISRVVALLTVWSKVKLDSPLRIDSTYNMQCGINLTCQLSKSDSIAISFYPKDKIKIVANSISKASLKVLLLLHEFINLEEESKKDNAKSNTIK